jgi:choline kinase/phosphatidylglycerophosphate synthase
MRAVLLAAGEGKRLRPFFQGPKPLMHLLGLSLLERNILTMRDCGIKEFIIVTGCYDEEIREFLGKGDSLGVSLKYLHNSAWKLGNGVSAYAFHREYRNGEKFILMMCDHIFEPKVVKSFITAAEKLAEGEVLLAADKRLEKVWDLEECTKIKAETNKGLYLGKNLTEYNAVDCGLFIGTKALLNSLAEAIAEKKYNLTDGVNRLAEKGKLKLHFVEGFWIDVDDLPSLKEAEKMLLKSLIPPKDGLISKWINRRFSLRLTKILASTSITPNQITLISFFLCLASAWCFAVVSPFWGGLLAQLSSIIDGVDGEIARLKFLKSNYGALFDAILDRYGDFAIVIGMTYAWFSGTGGVFALLVGLVALAGMPMSMLFKEKFKAISGKQFIPEDYDGVFRFVPANRDGRLLLIMLGGVFNLLPFTLILLAVISHFQTLMRLVKVGNQLQ